MGMPDFLRQLACALRRGSYPCELRMGTESDWVIGRAGDHKRVEFEPTARSYAGDVRTCASPKVPRFVYTSRTKTAAGRLGRLGRESRMGVSGQGTEVILTHNDGLLDNMSRLLAPTIQSTWCELATGLFRSASAAMSGC